MCSVSSSTFTRINNATIYKLQAPGLEFSKKQGFYIIYVLDVISKK